MIGKDEIRAMSRKAGKPAGMIEKDYALEWLLRGICDEGVGIRDIMIFKGGTSLSKVFYPGAWRYSEDLDFTLPPGTDPGEVLSGMRAACELIGRETGMAYESYMGVQPSGKAIMGRVSFVGPLGAKNRIKVDVSRKENMALPAATHVARATYRDLEDFPVRGYEFMEAVAEKIRGAMQRIRARDYYDIWRILAVEDHGLDTGLLGRTVRQKCELNGIEYRPSALVEPSRLQALGEYWEREVGRLLAGDVPDLREVFDSIPGLVSFLPPE